MEFEFDKNYDLKLSELKELVLTLEQSQHLKELGLNLKNSLFCYNKSIVDNKIIYDIILNKENKNNFEYIPTLTLEEIISLLPDAITELHKFNNVYYHYWLRVSGVGVEYSYYDLGDDEGGNFYELEYFYSFDRLLDNAYEALCWCLENGYKKY